MLELNKPGFLNFKQLPFLTVSQYLHCYRPAICSKATISLGRQGSRCYQRRTHVPPIPTPRAKKQKKKLDNTNTLFSVADRSYSFQTLSHEHERQDIRGTESLLWKPSGRGQLKCDGTRAETRFRLSAKRTSPFKSAGASVHSTTGSRGVHISGSNAGYTMLRGSVKGTGYPLHSPVSPHFPSCASPCAITFQLESTQSVC